MNWRLVVWDSLALRERVFPVLGDHDAVVVAGETWISRYPDDIAMVVDG